MLTHRSLLSGLLSSGITGLVCPEYSITARLRQPPTVPIAIVMGVTRLPGHKLSDSQTDYKQRYRLFIPYGKYFKYGYDFLLKYMPYGQ